MSRYMNETPLPQKRLSDSNVPTNDWQPPIDVAPKEVSECSASLSGPGSSFLTILLRALSAWSA